MPASQWLDGETCSRVALVLWQVTWSGSLLALIGAAAAQWGTQRAAIRCGIYCGTLAAMLALVPLWSLSASVAPSSPRATTSPARPAAISSQSTEIPLPAQQRPVASAPAVAETSPPAAAAPPSLVTVRPDRAAGRESAASDWVVRGVTIGYAAGLLAMLIRLVIGVWGGERLRSAGRPVEDPALLELMTRHARRLGLRVFPMLRTCERVAAPVVVGLLRPVVLVPASMLTGLTPDQLSIILTHELAHLRRHDHLFLLGQRIAEAVLFFHPAVWYLSRQIDQTREEACDDFVLAQGGDALEYARSLLRVAELRLGPATPLTALSVEGGSPSVLRRRIVRLLGMSDAPAMRLTRGGVASLLLGLIGAVSMTFALASDGSSDSFIAHFPDGVEVEFLGLGPFPSEGQPWWKPDGSPLAAGPKEKFGGKFSNLTPEQQAQCREIWLVVRGATDVVRSHAIVEGETQGSIGNYVFEPKDALFTLRRAGGPIPDRQKTKIQVGFSLADSLPLRTFDLEGRKTVPGASTEAIRKLDDLVQFQSFAETPEGLELRVGKLDGLQDKASIDVLAIDRDGAEVRPKSSTDNATSNGFVFKLAKDKLARFGYRLRPYTHWVTYDNVSLQPGSTTSLKVEKRIDSSVSISPRLEFRIVAQAPGGPRGPLAPNDWANHDYRTLTGKPAGPNATPGFVWAPVRSANERQAEQFKFDLPLEKTGDGGPFYLLSDAASETMLDDGSWQIVSARTSPSQFGQEVMVELDDAGGKKLSALTAGHLDCRLAILTEGRIVMAPVIRSQIGDKFVITGNFTKAECDDLVEVLSLPMARRISEEPAAFVEGQVVTPEGLGVADAEVAVTPNGDGGQPVTLLATARTDARGAYRIPIPAKLLESRQMVGVWARAEGYVAQRDNSVTFLKHLVRGKHRIKLFPASETTIALLDKDRKPVEGAKIRLSRVQVEEGIAYAFPEPWLREYGGTTSAEGRVTVRNISAETVRQVDVDLPNGARLRFDQDYFLNTKPLAEAPHFTIPAPEVGQVEGLFEWKAAAVKADDGGVAPTPTAEELDEMLTRPKSGGEAVQVNLLTEVTKPPFGTWAGIYGISTITLTGPQFRAVMPIGLMSVTTTMTAHQPLQPQVPARLVVQANETLPVVIPVQQGVKVRGQIRKRDTKEGIAKYVLRLIYGPSARDVNDQQHSVELTTDDQGFYTAYVPPGPVRIRLNRYVEGYADIEDWNDGPWNHRDKPLLVPVAGEFDLPPIDFDRAKQFVGRLVDENGKPLEDWTVYGFPTEWQEQYNGQKEPKSFVMNSFAGATTNEKGEFNGRGPVSYPPQRWRVSHRTWPTKFDSEDHTYVPKIRSRDPLILEVDLKAGPVPEDDEEAKDRDNEVIEQAGNKADDARKDAATESPPNRIIDAQGQSIAGATVEFQKGFKYAWMEAPPPIAQLTADADGRFTYPAELKDQSYFVVYVSAKGFQTRTWVGHHKAHRMVNGRLQPDTLVLQRPVTISGHVLNENGQPLADAEIAVDHFFEDGPAHINGNRVKTDADGRFTARDVPPAHVFVRYEPAYKTIEERAPVGVQKSRFCVLHLQPADGEILKDVVLDLRECRGVAEGQIVDENGKGAAGREIRVIPTAAFSRLDESITCKTDENGRFRFEGLTPGDYTFGPFAPDSSTKATVALDRPASVKLATYRTGTKPDPAKPEQLVWGQPNEAGLIAAIRFKPAKATYAPGDTVTAMAVVRNASKERRIFKYSASERSQVQILSDQNEVLQKFDYGQFTGEPYLATYVLQPGEEVVVSTFAIGLVVKEMGNTIPPGSTFQFPCEPGQKIPLIIQLSANVFGRPNDDQTQAFATGKTTVSVEPVPADPAAVIDLPEARIRVALDITSN